MSVFFAAARTAAASPVARVLSRLPLALAANDNGAPVAENEAVFRAALRHFGLHGLGAAHTAFDRAKQLLHDDDQPGSEHWAAICRMLDKRLADTLVRELAPR